jgi:predicted metal-dependent HD superfamily phosphohydrolase
MTDGLIDDRLRSELGRRYQAPGRHYHGLSHIRTLLQLAHQYRELIGDAEAVEAAIWFHDAIYDSRATDNEARSAALARKLLSGRAEPARLKRIAAMIEATADHLIPKWDDAAAANDAALFLDMDLAILGTTAEAFDRYEAEIRREYDWADEDAWRRGRSALLSKFLSRPTIFHTEAFRGRFEAPARRNLRRSLDSLSLNPPSQRGC